MSSYWNFGSSRNSDGSSQAWDETHGIMAAHSISPRLLSALCPESFRLPSPAMLFNMPPILK